MALTRIEILLDGLSGEQREQLLDVCWQELRISPGMVSADGNFELALTPGGVADEAPTVRVGDVTYPRLSLERFRQMLGQRGQERGAGARLR